MKPFDSTNTAAANRQLVSLDPQMLLAGQPSVANPVDVNARALQDGRNAHSLAFESRIEAIDQHLVLVKIHFAEGTRTARPGLGRQLQLRPRALLRARLDGQPGRGRPRQPNPLSRGRWRGFDRRRGGRGGRGQCLDCPGRRRRLWLWLGSGPAPLRGWALGRFRGGGACSRPGPGRLTPSPGRLSGWLFRRTHPRVS